MNIVYLLSSVMKISKTFKTPEIEVMKIFLIKPTTSNYFPYSLIRRNINKIREKIFKYLQIN